MYLMPLIGERLAESHNEVFDVHHDLALYDLFIHIYGVGNINVLHIDVIQQV